MKLLLVRYGSTPFGTFGEIRTGGKVFHTVEQDWEDNAPGKSCVPEGVYALRWLPTTTHVPPEYGGKTWYLSGGTVTHGHSGAHRTRCAIHIANTMDDVTGCIGIGRRLAVVNGRWAVAESGAAMVDFLDTVGPGDHELLIVQRPAG